MIGLQSLSSQNQVDAPSYEIVVSDDSKRQKAQEF